MTGVQTCALPICFPVTIGAVSVGLNGVHIKDGSEEVHVSINGVVVKDGGEETISMLSMQQTGKRLLTQMVFYHTIAHTVHTVAQAITDKVSVAA